MLFKILRTRLNLQEKWKSVFEQLKRGEGCQRGPGKLWREFANTIVGGKDIEEC
jgi:hypothetical protein